MPERIRLYRVEAVVLRRQNWQEADRLLTLFTRERGKLRAVAKGVRKPRSRKAGHLELFTRVRLLLARGRSLDLISQAETVAAYLPLREDLVRATYAHYVAELLNQFTAEGEEEPALFHLLTETLDLLCTAPDLRPVARAYELHLLGEAGLRPELHACVRCGRLLTHLDVNGEERRPPLGFSPAEGGVVCAVCTIHRPPPLTLSTAGLKVLQYLQTHRGEAASRLRLSGSRHAELERVLRRYIVHHLERQLKSVEFLNLLRREALSARP